MLYGLGMSEVLLIVVVAVVIALIIGIRAGRKMEQGIKKK